MYSFSHGSYLQNNKFVNIGLKMKVKLKDGQN